MQGYSQQTGYLRDIQADINFEGFPGMFQSKLYFNEASSTKSNYL